MTSLAIVSEEAKLWHPRLGHLPFNKLHHIDPKFPINNCYPDIICQVCPSAKHTRKPFLVSTTLSTHYFDLLHVDTWGPYKVKTHDNFVYSLTVVDDLSRHTWTFLMSNKTEAVDILEYLVHMILTQFHVSVKCIRTDNAKELCEGKILSLFSLSWDLTPEKLHRFPPTKWGSREKT